MIPIAAQAPREVELRRLGWGYQLARVLLLVVGCISTPDLGSSNGPPRTDRRPPPHETNETECQQMGREWVWNPQFAAGGYCKSDQEAPPLPIRFCQADAGVDAAPLPFCHHDAGADGVEGD